MAAMDGLTRDGLVDYGFSIQFQPDTGWRVYLSFVHFIMVTVTICICPSQSVDDKGVAMWIGPGSSMA